MGSHVGRCMRRGYGVLSGHSAPPGSTWRSIALCHKSLSTQPYWFTARRDPITIKLFVVISPSTPAVSYPTPRGKFIAQTDGEDKEKRFKTVQAISSYTRFVTCMICYAHWISLALNMAFQLVRVELKERYVVLVQNNIPDTAERGYA